MTKKVKRDCEDKDYKDPFKPQQGFWNGKKIQ